jgi:hypothetical protein
MSWLEEVHCRVLQGPTAWIFIQSDIIDDEDCGCNMGLYSPDMDAAEWQIVQKRLWQTVSNCSWNNSSLSRANLWGIKTLCQQCRKCYFTCQASQADLNLDQGASWCVLGNSWSDIGTKRWSRIVQVPLVLTLKWGRMQGGGWYHNSVKTSIFKILLIPVSPLSSQHCPLQVF